MWVHHRSGDSLGCCVVVSLPRDDCGRRAAWADVAGRRPMQSPRGLHRTKSPRNADSPSWPIRSPGFRDVHAPSGAVPLEMIHRSGTVIHHAPGGVGTVPAVCRDDECSSPASGKPLLPGQPHAVGLRLRSPRLRNSRIGCRCPIGFRRVKAVPFKLPCTSESSVVENSFVPVTPDKKILSIK